ncbi:unnamed protein product [Owenia fusiformis]|uniref:Uncharacterized protein n=1 Tax=Owenia fusiformis TaxID=6347 RepID=A0A8J1UNL2_OWEFU|nr:unnamed protein product [Owenia fusiformis]
MGKKKNKKEKKGKGAEKTNLKTEKNLEKRQKKELLAKGEDDIEALIAEFQENDRKLTEVQEEKTAPPSPRCSMTLTAHPDRDELILFGGEFSKGNKTYVYNDLYVYNIKHDNWSLMKAPNPPPPRNSHQTVAVKQGGGQLWIFGGEFESPSQSQFYHYRELWVLHLQKKQWEKVNAPNSPSARSGHRMVQFKKSLVVFGGFHDNTRSYKYYNDVYTFDLENYQWTKLLPSGTPPPPRSGCQMVVTNNGVVIYGGYSKEKVKRDLDKGITHTDMFLLTPDTKAADASDPKAWKWVQLKQGGIRPNPRCGFSLAQIGPNKALLFGGVHDEEDESDDDDEADLEGMFFNDLYTLDLDKTRWHELELRGTKVAERKRRRKKKDNATDDAVQESDTEDSMEEESSDIAEKVQKLVVDSNPTDNAPMETNESVFSLSQGGAAAQNKAELFTDMDSIMKTGTTSEMADESESEPFVPCSRMNALTAVKNNTLYLYGGMYEIGEKQITLSDFYSLDLHRLDEFKTIIENTNAQEEEWEDASSEEDDEEEDEDSEMEEGMPDIEADEPASDYFSRTRDFWFDLAEKNSKEEGDTLNTKQLKKLASMMAKMYHKEQTKE